MLCLDDVPLELVAAALGRSELRRLCCASSSWARLLRSQLAGTGVMLPALVRHAAARAILSVARRLRARSWIDAVARDCVLFHPFASRLVCNYGALRRFFGRGVASLPRLRATRRFAAVDDGFRCPECGARPVEAAVYWSRGHKAARSTPFLNLSCQDCVPTWDDDGDEEFYHAPQEARVAWTLRWRPIWA